MRRLAALSLSIAAALAGAGCEPLGEDGEAETSAAVSENGLSMNGLSLNGLSMNGLSMNGLSLNGLSLNGLSLNGLSMNGLMSTDGGRKLSEYIVKCALPDGHDLMKQDQYGNPYTLHGHLGLAPEWETGACGGPCKRWISACMLAHVNTAGVHIPINVVGQNIGIGWGQEPDYPNQEGTFFGNIFELNAVGLPDAYYCNGPGFDKDVVAGRVGANQPGAPYRNLFASGYCHLNGCVPSDAKTGEVPDGYKACGMGEGPMSAWNETITVWRQNKSYTAAAQLVSGQTADGRTIRYDFESGVNGWFSLNSQLVLSTSNLTVAQSGSKFLKATYNSGASTVRMTSPANLSLAAGTKVSFYVYLASDSKLTYINPFVKKAGGNEWKVSNPVSTVLKGSWNIVTITVPSGCSGTQVGVEFKTSGAFTASVDAITW
jgi:hypothetical protein